jgi:putative tricarboxylic transport membrane protein
MKISDTVVGAGFVAAGALVITATLNFPTLDAGHPGPSLFPRILGTLMILFGGLVSAQGLRSQDATDDVAWRHLHRNAGFVNALVVLVSVLGYILLVERLGFLIVGCVVMFAIMWRIQVPVLRAFVISVAFTNVVYLLFAKIMRVPLSLGLLWW